MWDYIYPRQNYELIHYGVPGMKWGVRRQLAAQARKGAYAKARMEDTQGILDRQEYRIAKRSAKGKSTERLERRAAKARAKAKKFKAMMNQNYKNLSGADIRQGQREYGAMRTALVASLIASSYNSNRR